MMKNIHTLFKKSKTLKSGTINKKEISKLISSLPNNDYCYNQLEVVAIIDKRNIFQYFKDIIYETNLFNLAYSKFGYYIPNYIRIISFFTFLYFQTGLVIIYNINSLTRSDLSTVKVSKRLF